MNCFFILFGISDSKDNGSNVMTKESYDRFGRGG